MLMLRLQRLGKLKNPSYRLIVSEKHKDTQSGTLENLGIYNPIVTPKVVTLNKERINYWLSVGAQMSASVNNLLLKEGVIKGEKQKSVYLSKTRKEKINKKKADEEAKAASSKPTTTAV